MAIASFLFYVPKQLGRAEPVLVPIVMLMLFVFSAAVTGSLIFGQPVLWYLDGKKKEAGSLLVATFVFFFALLLAALVAFFFTSGETQAGDDLPSLKHGFLLGEEGLVSRAVIFGAEGGVGFVEFLAAQRPGIGKAAGEFLVPAID